MPPLSVTCPSAERGLWQCIAQAHKHAEYKHSGWNNLVLRNPVFGADGNQICSCLPGSVSKDGLQFLHGVLVALSLSSPRSLPSALGPVCDTVEVRRSGLVGRSRSLSVGSLL